VGIRIKGNGLRLCEQAFLACKEYPLQLSLLPKSSNLPEEIKNCQFELNLSRFQVIEQLWF